MLLKLGWQVSKKNNLSSVHCQALMFSNALLYLQFCYFALLQPLYMDSRKPFSDRYQVPRDSHAPSYLQLVGKKMGEMYSESEFCPHSSGRGCDRMSTLLYVKGLHEATPYLWCGYDEVRPTHTATGTLYVTPIHYQSFAKQP